MAKAKITDPQFPRNLGTLYQDKTVGRKIGTLDQKFGQQVVRHAKQNFIPIWTKQTHASARLQKTRTQGGNTRWVAVSTNHQNKNLYDSKGRYGYKPADRKGKPSKPENVNKFEWFDRSYKYKRKQRHSDIQKGVYDA